MKRTKHSPAQIDEHLGKVEVLVSGGSTASEAVKSIGVSGQTYYRRKKQYGGMDKQDVRANCSTKAPLWLPPVKPGDELRACLAPITWAVLEAC
ncbi:MAG: hypothetical protein ACI80V_000950 [Rhodothermales bacterium]|jgi:hypothetical protein